MEGVLALLIPIVAVGGFFAWMISLSPVGKAYAERLKRVPPAWERAFEVNASSNAAMRASCVEFVLAGMHAHERISRATAHGRIRYET